MQTFSRNFLLSVAAITSVIFLGASQSEAATTFTTGAGSSVTSVDASADFESTDALFDNPYSEGGLNFSRSGLTFNNNSCGFAGCTTHEGFFSGPTPFTGNYLYGVGNSGSFFTIETTGSDLFFGLEMIVGTGFSPLSADTLFWETFLDGSSVSSGNENIAGGSLPGWFGWNDDSGFDTLVFGLTRGAPAFDQVRAQLSNDSGPSPVPLPMGALLSFSGLGMLAMTKWRQKKQLG